VIDNYVLPVGLDGLPQKEEKGKRKKSRPPRRWSADVIPPPAHVTISLRRERGGGKKGRGKGKKKLPLPVPAISGEKEREGGKKEKDKGGLTRI